MKGKGRLFPNVTLDASRGVAAIVTIKNRRSKLLTLNFNLLLKLHTQMIVIQSIISTLYYTSSKFLSVAITLKTEPIESSI